MTTIPARPRVLTIGILDRRRPRAAWGLIALSLTGLVASVVAVRRLAT